MSTKTVTISEMAYNRIISIKNEDETISDVIIRLCKESKEPDLITFLNSMPMEDRKDIAHAVMLSKKELDKGHIRNFNNAIV